MRLDIEMIPPITPEMVAETKREITARRNNKEGSSLKDIENAVCGVCGKNAVCFVDDMTIRVGDTDVPNLSGLRCNVCGDYAFDARSSKIILEMQKR